MPIQTARSAAASLATAAGRNASRLSLLLLALAVASAPGCSGGGRDGPRPGDARVKGSVFGGMPVVGATVALVDADAVSASTSLQPIEDLARATALSAVTDRDGEFSVDVPAGRYFICVLPADDDDTHLPGGDFARESIELAGGSTSVFGVTLSERPPDDATYVGSSTCLGCHTSHVTATQTLHFLGFRKLTAAGPELSSLQDLGAFPDADGALDFFVDGNADDNTGADAYGYRIATGEDYNILLGVDGTGYFQALETLDGTLVSERLYIAFTYGGEGRFKQRFVTRLDKDGLYTATPSAGSYYLLPGQYSETTGSPHYPSEETDPLWVTYNAERWAAPAINGGAVGASPTFVQSFDNDCAGCHFTGMSLTRDVDGLFQAHATPDAGGPLDFDGDGEAEEMNVGCERCHGAGSAHVAAAGGSIVQPDLLPPGRSNLICGQCHTRGSGNGTVDGEGEGGYPSRNDPDSGDIEFVSAGMSPSEFFGTPDGDGVLPHFGTSGGFFDPIDLRTSAASWRDATDGYGGDLDHSRSHRQQYLDHTRSTHARNRLRSLACWDCHDPHERERQAQVLERIEDNVLCFDCHAGLGDFAAVDLEDVDTLEASSVLSQEMKESIHEHITQRTFDLVGVAMNLDPTTYGNPAADHRLGRCVVCHMPRTARNGSWITDDEGFVIRGDASSHTFRPISPDTSEAMALDGVDPPITNACVDCHRGLLRGAYPDYRYKP